MGGCGSVVGPASCYQKVAGSAPLVCVSKCPWARYWTPKLLLMCWSTPCMAATAIGVGMCVWITVSCFGQKCPLDALKCKCHTHRCSLRLHAAWCFCYILYIFLQVQVWHSAGKLHSLARCQTALMDVQKKKKKEVTHPFFMSADSASSHWPTAFRITFSMQSKTKIHLPSAGRREMEQCVRKNNNIKLY